MDSNKRWKQRARRYVKRLHGHGLGSSELGKTLQRLFESKTWYCPYTKVKLNLDNVSVDHIVPISKGGSNSLSNLQFVSQEANQRKGNLYHHEFAPNVSIKALGSP